MTAVALAEAPQAKPSRRADSSSDADCGVQGEVVATRRFEEGASKHVLIAAVLNTPDETADSNFSDLTVADFSLASDGCEELWRFEDRTAGFQTSINFIPDSLRAVDEDGDGHLDFSFAYQFVSDTDAHPIPSFIVLRIGNQDMRLQCHTKVQVGPGDVQGGECEMDVALTKATATVRARAFELWRQFDIAPD